MADQAGNIFEGETGTPPATPPSPQTGSLDDLLKNIKNESGEQKYKSLEDALVALDHSQKYIPELKTQLTSTQQKLQEMTEQMAKMSSLEENVQRLLAAQQGRGDTPPAATGLDEQAVLKMIQNTLTQSEQQRMASMNQKAVNDSLVEKYGDKAPLVLQEKATELGTTKEALGELAKQNPRMVLALFGSDKPATPTPTIPGRVAPPPVDDPTKVRKSTRGMLSGVSSREQASRLEELRKAIYAKHGISA